MVEWIRKVLFYLMWPIFAFIFWYRDGISKRTIAIIILSFIIIFLLGHILFSEYRISLNVDRIERK